MIHIWKEISQYEYYDNTCGTKLITAYPKYFICKNCKIQSKKFHDNDYHVFHERFMDIKNLSCEELIIKLIIE